MKKLLSILIVLFSMSCFSEVTTISDEAYLQIRFKKGTLRGEYHDCLYFKLTDAMYTWLRGQLSLTLPGVRAEEQARVQAWLDMLAEQRAAIKATKAELRAQRQAYLDMIAAVDAEYPTAPGE